MNTSERDRLIRTLLNPPPGSKVAAAREFGIDLTLTLRKLQLTPDERLRELAAAQLFIAQLRRAKRHLR